MNQYQYDTKVIQEWVDHNGHMNDAEYNRVLSDATDDWLAHLGLTLETIKTLHYTVFTLENHLTFLKEMKLDEDISEFIDEIEELETLFLEEMEEHELLID